MFVIILEYNTGDIQILTLASAVRRTLDPLAVSGGELWHNLTYLLLLSSSDILGVARFRSINSEYTYTPAFVYKNCIISAGLVTVDSRKFLFFSETACHALATFSAYSCLL